MGNVPWEVVDLLERREHEALKAGRAKIYKGRVIPVMGGGDAYDYSRLRYSISADGTAVTAAAETIVVPAFNFSNSEMNMPTKGLKFTLAGRISQAITTPGTFINRMRWGGVAGALCATGDTIAPTGTQAVTNVAFILEYYMTVRSVGAAGTLWCQGRWECPGTLETTPGTTTIMVTHLKNRLIPSSAPAVSAAIDFTGAFGPTPTFQPSLGTGSFTVHEAWLELKN